MNAYPTPSKKDETGRQWPHFRDRADGPLPRNLRSDLTPRSDSTCRRRSGSRVRVGYRSLWFPRPHAAIG